jgi:hypothetical protein
MSILRALSRAIPHCKVGHLEQALGAVLGADSVEFWYADGAPARPVRSDAQAQYVLDRPVRMQVKFTCGPEEEAPVAPSIAEHEADSCVAGKMSATPLGSAARAARPELERFIRELDGLERKSSNGFVWIKFLVQERIPQLGIAATEANAFLDALLREGVVATKKVPNPNRPGYPSTGVILNRNHSLVQQILRSRKIPEFQPLETPGGPWSDDLVRDRR